MIVQTTAGELLPGDEYTKTEYLRGGDRRVEAFTVVAVEPGEPFNGEQRVVVTRRRDRDSHISRMAYPAAQRITVRRGVE